MKNWFDSLCCWTAACVVSMGGVLATVNVGVAVAVTWSWIVITSQLLLTIGLPEHQQHSFRELQSRAGEETCGSGQSWSMKGRGAAVSPHWCSQTGPAVLLALWYDKCTVWGVRSDISRLSYLYWGLIITNPIQTCIMYDICGYWTAQPSAHLRSPTEGKLLMLTMASSSLLDLWAGAECREQRGVRGGKSW